MVPGSDDDAFGTRHVKTSPGMIPVHSPPARARATVLHEIPTRLVSRGTDGKHPVPARAFTSKPNATIGRFELIREIARGGMGQVFLGRDTQLGRKVAIKFLLQDDARFVQRFLVEARATARCTHENIVTIFEVGEHAGLPYMVLEYLEGKTLDDVLETRPTPRQFVELMVPVVRALERAHEHSIVHRDLKPQNIFVTDRGQVKVLDFGIARIVDRNEADIAARATAGIAVVPFEQELTEDNSQVGTVPYMSPEQFGVGEVDHLSDLWAVGIMFWRALVGVHPAGSMVPKVLRERVCDLDTPLPSLTATDPTIPRPLAAIVDRCLAKRKADRYPSASALLADLEAFLVPPAERVAHEPYRGLGAFGEQDAKYFFGRSNEIRTALAQLESWPLLAVVGPSGVGKSSFVHAGLVPAMRSSGGDWQVKVLRPGRVPLHRLAGVLEDTLATGESGGDLMRKLLEGPGVFGAMLRAAAVRRNANILVVVDQLEELFTLCDSDDLRRIFLAALLAAADDPAAPVRVVLVMRADFLDRLAAHRAFLTELSRGLFFLTAPEPENLRETLVRPAELAGYAFEDPGIVEDMMHAATSRGALPLLSFAASRLWDARDRQRRLLTVGAYQAMGGVGGAFARHADQVAAAVPAQSQALLRAIMVRLVTPDGTRAVVDRSELLSLTADPQEAERILDRLVRARLIHMHADPGHDTTVEIVHEMLITEWPMLGRWLEESHAIRAFTHELQQAAKQWHARGMPSDLVWRGATARDALGHAQRHVLALSAIETQFLGATRRQLARSRRRKLLVFVSVATALAIVLAGGSIAVVRIKLAEGQAEDKARQAELARAQADIDRKAAIDATAQLQSKIDALEAEKKARAVAEQDKLAAEVKREVAEDDLARSKALSREQLEAANRALVQQVAEARKARDEATAAKKDLELRLAKERAAREREQKQLRDKGLVTDPLIGGGN